MSKFQINSGFLTVAIITGVLFFVIGLIIFGIKGYGRVAKIARGVLSFSLVASICICAFGTSKLYSGVKTSSARAVQSSLSAEVVQEAYANGKISSTDYCAFLNGNCEVSAKKNVDYTWFGEYTVFVVTYNI